MRSGHRALLVVAAVWGTVEVWPAAAPPAAAAEPITYAHVGQIPPTIFTFSGDLTHLGTYQEIRNLGSGQTIALPTDRIVARLDRTAQHALVVTPAVPPFGAYGLRVRTLATGTERVVEPSGLGEFIDISEGDAALSADGSLAVFATFNPATLRRSVWAQRGTDPAVDITAGLPGVALNRRGSEPSISADGRYVAFAWGAYDAGCPEPGPRCIHQIVRYDTVTGQHLVVSLGTSGAETRGIDRWPAISGDGRYVAWLTDAMDVVPGLTTQRVRLYLRDTVAGTTHLLAASATTNVLGRVLMSDDGRRVATTLDGPVGAGTSNDIAETVHLIDLTDGSDRTFAPPSGGRPLTRALLEALSPDGTGAVFSWFGPSLVPGPCCTIVRATAPRAAGAPGPLVFPVVPPGPPIPTGRGIPLAIAPPSAREGFITAITPDGRYIGINDGDTIPTGVARIEVRTGATVHIPTVGPARLSGDGRFMATADCRWDLASGAVERVNPMCSEVSGAVSADGSVVFAPTDPPTLWRPGSTPTVFPVGTPGFERILRWWMSTDGRQLTVWRVPAVTCTTPPCGQLVRFDVATRAATVLPLPADFSSPEVSADGAYVVFVSEAAGVTPGATAGRRIHRLHVPSGELRPTASGPVVAASVSDDGKVVYLTEGIVTEDGALTDGPRVGLWQDGWNTLIDWGHDGRPPDFPRGGVGVGGVAYTGVIVSGDGRTALWASGARNIVPGRTTGGLVIADLTAVTPPVAQGATAVVPERLLDTRPGSQVGYTGAKPGPDSVVELAVSGVGTTAVPADASAVVLNVTATEATADGYVTVWPCSRPRPTASNLNVGIGQTVPNLVAVELGAGGAVCLYTQSGTHLIADIAAWYPAGSAFRPVLPERLLDTRLDVGHSGGAPGAGGVVALRVTEVGASAVPADAVAVVLNVTGTEAAADGFVTVWPCGTERPTASNLNLRRGGTRPNLVAVKVGDDGTVCLYSQSGTHLVADLAGWFPAASAFTSVVPERLLDTRTGVGAPAAKPAAGAVVELQVTGAGVTTVPADATTVLLNVTGTEATADGFVTVWPCGAPRPTASNLNLVAGETAPNLVSVKLGVGGRVCLFTQSGTHLVADITGYER